MNPWTGPPPDSILQQRRARLPRPPLERMERSLRILMVCTAVNAIAALVQTLLWWARQR